MFKCVHLLQPFTRRGINWLLFHARHKTHIVDSTYIPAHLEGTALINEFPYSVEIESIDLTTFSDLDGPFAKATLFLRTSDEQELDRSVVEEFNKNINYEFVAAFERNCHHYIKVGCTERKKHSDILPPNVEVGVRLEVPLKFGVRVKAAEDATVHVRNLEGESYEITTQNANCYLTNLKGSHISVETSGGSITSDSSLISTFGSLVTRGDGTISVSKLQGSKFYLETEDGNIDAKALYLLRSEFCSQHGDIRLGDVHGITEVEAGTGNISVGSVMGDLKALTKQGDIDVYLAEHNSVDVRSRQGSVEVSISDSPRPSQVNIKSKQVHIAENVDMRVDLEQKGENFTVLSARTNPNIDTEVERTLNIEAKLGEVKVKVTNWLDSLKL